jgi:hypothetical protein
MQAAAAVAEQKVEQVQRTHVRTNNNNKVLSGLPPNPVARFSRLLNISVRDPKAKT